MTADPQSLSLDQWDQRYHALCLAGLREPGYGGPLRRHLADGGDIRLVRLRYDNSPAALRLWNFLLTEEDRLREARRQGMVLVGAMKDLGTVPVMAFALPRMVAFYPDGAWWTPCMMQSNQKLLDIAEGLGLGESFCPVRAMAGAFVNGEHFPIPNLLVCSTGAICDDFSAIAQRVEGLGHPIFWWEIPFRRAPEADEASEALPGGGRAPACHVEIVERELARVAEALSAAAGQPLDTPTLMRGIDQANRFRNRLAELRRMVYLAPRCPLPALEMLIAEMLAIHFCSDQAEAIAVIEDLLVEVHRRVAVGTGVLSPDAVRVFWVNPVADLYAMNLLEQAGGRICGSDYMFAHALEPIPVDRPPLHALAQMALSDPMVGPSSQRAAWIARQAELQKAEAVVISRIPGASHCAWEGRIIAEHLQAQLKLPVVEIEVPPVLDSTESSLRTRLEALVEAARSRRA